MTYMTGCINLHASLRFFITITYTKEQVLCVGLCLMVLMYDILCNFLKQRLYFLQFTQEKVGA